MPRKGGGGGGKGTKAAAKATAKVVNDKTFGMKNKNKSKKVQQYISQVKNQTEAKYNPKKVHKKFKKFSSPLISLTSL